MSAVQEVQERPPFVAAIDPVQWLKSQKQQPRKPGGRNQVFTSLPPFLAMGFEAIEGSKDMLEAMSGNTSIQAEIVMAYLLSDNGIGEYAKQKIIDLARLMDQISG